ncbi:gamma-secretase subunit pen-2 [Planococcus citri]|uniref:gamma-secretase subunit pen-2 n=1 Tax=Planococcus citri TaxID=170843 RepID=UPI0031F7E61C
MDKTHLNNPEKLRICRYYYYLGFFCLPVLWAINYVWFKEEANFKPEFAEQKEIQTLRRRSGIGAVIWLIAIICWVIQFQMNRSKWGEFGENISFIIPTGSA